MYNDEKMNDVLPDEKQPECLTNTELPTSNQNESSNSLETSTEKSKKESATESKASVVVENTTTPSSTNTEKCSTLLKPNKIIAFLKSKIGICFMATILIVGVLTAFLINKYDNERKYEKNLKEFIIESGKSIIFDTYLCDNLHTVWQEYIFDDKVYFNNSNGTFSKYYSYDNEYCSNFSEAVNRKIQWNKGQQTFELTEFYRKAERLYKDMTPPPGKYKEIHTYVKQIFKAMERLHDLSENPTGNLSTYSSYYTDAVNDYSSALSDLSNECKIDFSKVEDD